MKRLKDRYSTLLITIEDLCFIYHSEVYESDDERNENDKGKVH